jgi:hypothetical protein
VGCEQSRDRDIRCIASRIHSDQVATSSIVADNQIQGKVVLLSRGGCGFLEKAKWAQRRGGVALIVGE